ncbi:hypothetical protein [Maribacter sp. 2308TA10-17]|uniref:hypothetical protein n=1 Tax=Maribacter sp. 2308TA10-17 TaxID=3386276 RepID=UPI0039BCB691
MSIKYKLIYSIGLLILICSCNTEKTSFYQGQYFQANQELELIINDGEYVYNKKFVEQYSRGNYQLIKRIKSQNDSIKVYLKIDNKDTLLFLPSSTEKVLFGNDAYRNLFIYTEKDTVVWMMD